MEHIRKNIRSTKILANTSTNVLRPQHNTTMPQMHKTSHIDDYMEVPIQERDNVATKDFFIKITDVHKVHTNQTEKFPTKSSRGAQYCFVMYSYDTNAILVYPIKNRSTNELLQAYDKGITYLTMKGFKPNMHFLDNEAPEQLQQYDIKNNIPFNLSLLISIDEMQLNAPFGRGKITSFQVYAPCIQIFLCTCGTVSYNNRSLHLICYALANATQPPLPILL